MSSEGGIKEDRGKRLLDLIRGSVKNLLSTTSKKIAERKKEIEGVLYDNSPELDHFCLCLEHIFVLNLKEVGGFFGGGKTREWWDYIRTLAKTDKAASNTIENVINMNVGKTPAGKARAWIRVCLIEKKLKDYLQKLMANAKITAEYYERDAILRDPERSQMLVGILELLGVINFNLYLKDCDFDGMSLDQTLSSLQISSSNKEVSVVLQYEAILAEFGEVQKILSGKEAMTRQQLDEAVVGMANLQQKLTEQSEELERLQSQVLETGAALESEKFRYANLEADMDKLRRESELEMEELKAQLEAKKAVQSQLSTMVKTHQQTINKLNEDLKKSSPLGQSEEMEKLKEELEASQSELQKAKEEHRKEMEDLKSSHEKEILELERSKELAVATAKSEKDKEIIELLKTRKSPEESEEKRNTQNDELVRVKSEKLLLEREILKHEQAQSKFQRSFDLQKSEFDLSLKKKEREKEEIESELAKTKSEIIELKSKMEKNEEKIQEDRKMIHSLQLQLKEKDLQFHTKEKELDSQLRSEIEKSFSFTLDGMSDKMAQKKEKYKLQIKEIQEANTEKEQSYLVKVGQLESKLSELRTQNTELKSQNRLFEEIKVKYEDLLLKNEQLSSKISDLNLNLDRLKVEKDSELESLKTQKKQNELRLETEKEKIERELDALKKEFSSLKENHFQLEEKKNSLEQKNQEISKEMEKKQEQLSNESLKLSKMDSKNDSLSSELKELNEKTKELKKKIQKYEAEEIRLKSQFSESMEHLKRQLESAEHNVMRLQSQLEQREETIVRLTSEKGNLEDKLTSLDSKLESGLNQIEFAKKEEIEKKSNRLEQLQALTLHQERTIEEQKALLQEKDSQLSFSDGKIKELKENLEKLGQKGESEQNILREKIEEFVQQNGEMGVKLKSFEEEISELRLKENGFLETINKKEENEKNLMNEIKELKKISSDFEKVKEELENEQKKIELLQKEKSQFQVQISEQKAKISSLQEEKQKLEEEIQLLSENVSNKEIELSSLQSENENLKSENFHSKNELSLSNEKNQSLSDLVSEKEEKFSELQKQKEEENSKLKEKIAMMKGKRKEMEIQLQNIQLNSEKDRTQKEKEIRLEMETRISEEKEKIETLTNEINEMARKHSTFVAEFESSLKSEKALSKEMKEKLETKETEIQRIKAEKENILDDLSLEKNLVESKVSELDQLKKTYEEIRAKNEELETNNRLLSEEIEKAKGESLRKSRDFEGTQNLIQQNETLFKEEKEKLLLLTEEQKQNIEDLKKDLSKEKENFTELNSNFEKLEKEEKERGEEKKQLEGDVDSLRKLVALQKKSLSTGDGDVSKDMLLLEIKDLNRQMEIIQNLKKGEIESEIQFLLTDMRENSSKLREAREQVSLIENYRQQVDLLLKGDVQKYVQQTPNAVAQWKQIASLTGESLSFLSSNEREEHEKNRKESIGLKHDLEELQVQLSALRGVVKEQSISITAEKANVAELQNANRNLERDIQRLTDQLKKADEINCKKEEELIRLQQIEEENGKLQKRSELKDTALRSLNVQHQELEEVHRQQTSFIEQLKGKVAQNAKTIKQLSVSIHAMGAQLQKAQAAEAEHEATAHQLKNALITIDEVAKISPQVALEATGKTGLNPGDPSNRQINVTDKNAANFIAQLQKEKKSIEETLADIQLKYMNLCRLVGENSQTKEEDVAELDAAFNFQMRVEKVRKKERELMQEIHTMSEKESILTDSLQASQLMLRQLKSSLESNTRKTDRLAERVVDLMEQNRELARNGITKETSQIAPLHLNKEKFDPLEEFESDEEEKEERRKRMMTPGGERRRGKSHSTLDRSSSNSELKKTAMKEWVRDEDVKKCQGCSSSFGLMTRRHHCRNCGKIYCASCSSRTSILPKVHKTQPQRICDDCFLILKIISPSG